MAAAEAADAAADALASMWVRMPHQIGAEKRRGWMEPRWWMIRSLWAEPVRARIFTRSK